MTQERVTAVCHPEFRSRMSRKTGRVRSVAQKNPDLFRLAEGEKAEIAFFRPHPCERIQFFSVIIQAEATHFREIPDPGFTNQHIHCRTKGSNIHLQVHPDKNSHSK